MKNYHDHKTQTAKTCLMQLCMSYYLPVSGDVKHLERTQWTMVVHYTRTLRYHSLLITCHTAVLTRVTNNYAIHAQSTSFLVNLLGEKHTSKRNGGNHTEKTRSHVIINIAVWAEAYLWGGGGVVRSPQSAAQWISQIMMPDFMHLTYFKLLSQIQRLARG
jgi:hypothetical protein